MIELTPSTKVKQLRQSIKDQLGIKEKVNIKLYLQRGASGVEEEKKKEDKEEVKEGDEQEPEGALADLLEEGTGMIILTDDKVSLASAGIIDRANKLEVEIVIRVSVDV